MDKLVIIDGNSIAYRAFYALPILSNRKGLFTNAIFGFTNMLFKTIDDLKPTHMAVVFDYPAKTFRHNLFKEYKATRKPMPAELSEQIPVIKDVLKLLGIKVLEQEGFEADDIIGTLAKKIKLPTVIVTGDKDCLQLIDDTTSVMLTKKGLTDTVMMDREAFLNEYRFEPKGIIDLKAFMGDSSDNIPGVKGIGEKGARSLIEKYDNIENVYKHIDDITGRTKTLLIEQKDIAKLSYELATINTAMAIKDNAQDLKFEICLGKEIRDKLEELEFNAILKRKEFLSNNKEAEHVQYTNIEITTLDDLKKLNNITDQIAICVKEDEIHIACDEKNNYIIRTKKDLIEEGISFKDAIKFLKHILEDGKIQKICFDFKKLKTYLEQFDIMLDPVGFDIHLAYWIVDSSKNPDNEEGVFEFAGESSVSACGLFRCQKVLMERMEELDLAKIYNDIEIPLVTVLFDMEKSGICVSRETLDELLVEYREKEQALVNNIYNMAGQKFNVNSSQQLGNVLFDVLGLRAGKKRSTAVDVLLSLREDHPIVNSVLEYRTLNKIISTYLMSFKDFIDKNGFIHTTYNQTGTVTGRLSSTQPNLQNIPVKKDEGKAIRKMFISRFKNGKIVSADYNQIELRLVAHLTQDAKMIEAFNAGKDIHKITASEIFNVPLNEVSAKQRNRAKAVNFGIVYGISSFGLSEQIGVSPKEAGEYIKKYFEAYPQIKEYMSNIIEKAKSENGYVTTFFGRKRKVDEIFSDQFHTRQFGERVIMNMPFQGGASDIIKIAMINIARKFKESKLQSKLILQIHDELIVDACENEVDIVEQILKEEMENVIKLSIPLTVDVESGKTWFDV